MYKYLESDKKVLWCAAYIESYGHSSIPVIGFSKIFLVK